MAAVVATLGDGCPLSSVVDAVVEGVMESLKIAKIKIPITAGHSLYSRSTPQTAIPLRPVPCLIASSERVQTVGIGDLGPNAVVKTNGPHLIIV